MEKVNCPHCHKKTVKTNFCTECGRKIVDVCDCWVLHKKYNCGYKKCPAWGILFKAKESFLLLRKQQ